jgi:hypothetical protein
MTTETPEQIAQHYKAMGDSVYLINSIISGTKYTDKSESEKKDTISRNVEHLEIMMSKDFWTDEDMTEVHLAISYGKQYISE